MVLPREENKCKNYHISIDEYLKRPPHKQKDFQDPPQLLHAQLEHIYAQVMANDQFRESRRRWLNGYEAPSQEYINHVTSQTIHEMRGARYSNFYEAVPNEYGYLRNNN